MVQFDRPNTPLFELWCKFQSLRRQLDDQIEKATAAETTGSDGIAAIDKELYELAWSSLDVPIEEREDIALRAALFSEYIEPNDHDLTSLLGRRLASDCIAEFGTRD